MCIPIRTKFPILIGTDMDFPGFAKTFKKIVNVILLLTIVQRIREFPKKEFVYFIAAKFIMVTNRFDDKILIVIIVKTFEVSIFSLHIG